MGTEHLGNACVTFCSSVFFTLLFDLQPIFLWAGGWKRFFGQGENQIPEAG